MKWIKGIFLTIVIFIIFFCIDSKHIDVNFSSIFNTSYPLTAIAAPCILFLTFYVIYIRLETGRALFLKFVVPIFLAIYTIVTGTYGFYNLETTFDNALFKAANLLTLSTSVLEYDSTNGQSDISLWLINARLIGGVFVCYAFFLAFSLATGAENMTMLSFWWIRKVLRKKFSVVIGYSKKAEFLVRDLASRGEFIVYLDIKDISTVSYAERHNRVFPFSVHQNIHDSLYKTYFFKAQKVYVIGESDDRNFQVCQNMLDIFRNQETRPTHWYIELNNLRKRSLLFRMAQKIPDLRAQLFSTDQNKARNIVVKNHTDQIAQPNISIILNIIWGFNSMSIAIIMQLLRIGHFAKHQTLRIIIYYQVQEKENVDEFIATHPELFKNLKDAKSFSAIKSYTFLHHGPIVEFTEIPKSQSELIHPSYSLYDSFNAHTGITLYSCLENGLESAAIMALLLSRLKPIVTPQTKFYIFYNFNNPTQKAFMQNKLREIMNNEICIECFGNDIDHYRGDVIEDRTRDLLAQYLAFIFQQIYSPKAPAFDSIQSRLDQLMQSITHWQDQDLVKFWDELSEVEKESNRQAADHAYIKMLLIGHNHEEHWNDQFEFQPSDLIVLGEIEHRRWCAEKLLRGWIPTAEGVSQDLWRAHKQDYLHSFQHYQLKPFDRLSSQEKDKDYLQFLVLPFIFNTILRKTKNQ